MTWSVKNGPVTEAGTYSVKAVFTFRKKNGGVSDPTFDVASNTIDNVVVTANCGDGGEFSPSVARLRPGLPVAWFRANGRRGVLLGEAAP